MIRLYRPVTIKRKSFKGVKKVVVPNQSMTLQQILKRFIKREPLPVEHKGYYEDRYDYDLDKVLHEDPVEKSEIFEDVKANVEAAKQKAEKAQTSAMEKAKAKKKQEEEALFATWQEKQKDPKTSPPKQPD